MGFIVLHIFKSGNVPEFQEPGISFFEKIDDLRAALDDALPDDVVVDEVIDRDGYEDDDEIFAIYKINDADGQIYKSRGKRFEFEKID